MKEARIEQKKRGYFDKDSCSSDLVSRTTKELFGGIFPQLLKPGTTGLEPAFYLITLTEFFTDQKTGENRNTSLILPKGFENWSEWERIVVSMLKAKTRLILADAKDPLELAILSLERIGMTGGFSDGISKDIWLQIFNVLQKDGGVALSDALAFFRRVDGKHDHFKQDKTYPFHRGHSIMLSEWIHLDSDSRGSLCAFDNNSAALILAKQKGLKASDAMSGPNFSRLKKNLGLISCRNPLWKAQFSDEEEILITERRGYHRPSG